MHNGTFLLHRMTSYKCRAPGTIDFVMILQRVKNRYAEDDESRENLKWVF